MIEPKIVTIIYQSGRHPTENWEVMQVVGKYENGTVAISYVLARDAAGIILRKTDIVLERWEIVTDEEDLRICRKHFDDRDALAANQSQSPTE
jgi:hypothetical protein